MGHATQKCTGFYDSLREVRPQRFHQADLYKENG